jgi:hypothetical protein
MAVRLGYGRVSTRDQSPDGQRDALAGAGCEEILIDHASSMLQAAPSSTRRCSSGAPATSSSSPSLIASLARASDLAQRRPLGAGCRSRRARSGDRHFDCGRADVLPDLWSDLRVRALADVRARPRRPRGRPRHAATPKPKLTPDRTKLAHAMYYGVGADGRHAHTPCNRSPPSSA